LACTRVPFSGLSPVTQRLIIILSTYDVRASMFGIGMAKLVGLIGQMVFGVDGWGVDMMSRDHPLAGLHTFWDLLR
jgi:hypothetical protein